MRFSADRVRRDPDRHVGRGLRYNSEQRDFVVDYTGAPIPGRRTTGRIDDDVVIPSGGVDSATVAGRSCLWKGQSRLSGSWVQRPARCCCDGADAFDAEEMTAYEMGIKSQFVDRRVTLNAAGFWYDYSDLQVRNTIGLGLTSIGDPDAAERSGRRTHPQWPRHG